jgi:hypothetical protein
MPHLCEQKRKDGHEGNGDHAFDEPLDKLIHRPPSRSAGPSSRDLNTAHD